MISKFKSGVYFVEHTEHIGTALDKMESLAIGSVLVVNKSVAVGIFTERDLLKIWRKLADPSFLKQPISDVMTHPVFTIMPQDLSQAPKIMMDRHIRHLPIVDAGGLVLGVLSIRDVVKAQLNSQLDQDVVPHFAGSSAAETGAGSGGAGGAGGSAAAAGSASAQQGQLSQLSQLQRPMLHLITPSPGLDISCRSLLPQTWLQKTWLNPDEILDDSKFGAEYLAGNCAVFIDFDGLKGHNWRDILKKFIKSLTHQDQPEVFVTWSPHLLPESELDAILKVATTAHWHVFQKPLSFGSLSEQFRSLNKRVVGRGKGVGG